MRDDSSCPVCGRAVQPTEAKTLHVCGECSETLEAATSGQVQRTGEFAAMSPERAADMLAGQEAPDPPAATGAAGTLCSWCGKLRSEVKKMLSSGESHICNECVALCADILTAELGDGWRG